MNRPHLHRMIFRVRDKELCIGSLNLLKEWIGVQFHYVTRYLPVKKAWEVKAYPSIVEGWPQEHLVGGFFINIPLFDDISLLYDDLHRYGHLAPFSQPSFRIRMSDAEFARTVLRADRYARVQQERGEYFYSPEKDRQDEIDSFLIQVADGEKSIEEATREKIKHVWKYLNRRCFEESPTLQMFCLAYLSSIPEIGINSYTSHEKDAAITDWLNLKRRTEQAKARQMLFFGRFVPAQRLDPTRSDMAVYEASYLCDSTRDFKSRFCSRMVAIRKELGLHHDPEMPFPDDCWSIVEEYGRGALDALFS